MGYLGRKPETLAGVVELSSNVASSIVNANVGILSNLQTTIKTNVVAAINEVRGGGFSNVQITGGQIANTTITGGTITPATLNASLIYTGNLSGNTTYANVFPGNVAATEAQILTGNVIFQGAGNGVTLTKSTSTSTKYIPSATGMANLNYLESDTWYIDNVSSDTTFNFYNVPTGNGLGTANVVISTATVIYPASSNAYKSNAWVNGSPAGENTFLYGTIPVARPSAINVYTFTIIAVRGQTKILGSHAYYDTF